jgi:hypothetical protein
MSNHNESSYMAPSQFLRANKVKVTAGMILDPQQMGMADHPSYGPLPVVLVLEAKQDGSIFLLGEIKCDCGATREIHPGDWFQVRGCETCTKKARRRGKSARKTDEEKAAAQAERELKYAEDKLARLEAKKTAAVAHAAKLAAELEERKALIAQVAAEKGVEVAKS